MFFPFSSFCLCYCNGKVVSEHLLRKGTKHKALENFVVHKTKGVIWSLKKKKLLRVQWDSKLVEVWDMIFFPHYCLHVKWQVPYKVYVKYICFPSHSHFYRHKGRENLEILCGSGTLSPGTLWTLIFRIKLDIVLKIIVSMSWNSQIKLY